MAPRNKARIWTNAGLAALFLATVGAVGFALFQPATPPPVSAQVSEYLRTAPPAVTDNRLPITRPEAAPLKAVFAGDSLTYGLFASSEAAGYRPQVVAALSTSGPVEASRGGQVGNKIADVSASITFPADTNLIVLALGTNDVWKTDAKVAKEQYTSLVEKARTSAPDAALVCLGVWSNKDGARNYDPAIKQPCLAAGGIFLPITDLFEKETNRGPAGVQAFGGASDTFHPNDAGYKAIADRLLSAVVVK
jgi:acyl-CoA thioesterase-1